MLSIPTAEEIMGDELNNRARCVSEWTLTFEERFKAKMEAAQNRMITERHLLHMDKVTRARAEKVLSGTYRGTL